MIKSGGQYRIVFVTCASIAQARIIGRSVITKKLVACANILPGVRSIYRWRGKVETAREVLLMMKTTASHLTQLEKEVNRLHSYDVPEFIALPIAAGSSGYLKWLQQNSQ